MPFPNIDPIAFAIGPVVVRWYALAYLIGVLGGAAYATTLLRRHGLWKDNRPPFEPAAIWDFAFWAVVGIIIGGRVGYVLFYNLGYYAANPGEIIALWDGGMSFHGGLVGIMLAMALFVRSKGGNILSGMDLLGAIGTIGLFLGRVANFINAELYGAPTTLPWAVVFPTDPEQLPRHPSQLYEALLEGVLLFIVIRIATNHLGRAQEARARRRHFRHRLCAQPHLRRVLPPARRPARLSLWRLAHHGHGAEPAHPRRRHRPRRLRHEAGPWLIRTPWAKSSTCS